MPTAFSRGRMIRVGLTYTGIRHGNASDVLDSDYSEQSNRPINSGQDSPMPCRVAAACEHAELTA